MNKGILRFTWSPSYLQAQPSLHCKALSSSKYKLHGRFMIKLPEIFYLKDTFFAQQDLNFPPWCWTKSFSMLIQSLGILPMAHRPHTAQSLGAHNLLPWHWGTVYSLYLFFSLDLGWYSCHCNWWQWRKASSVRWLISHSTWQKLSSC